MAETNLVDSFDDPVHHSLILTAKNSATYRWSESWQNAFAR